MSRWLLSSLIILATWLPAYSATYQLDVTTNAEGEAVLNKAYKRECKDRIANAQSELPTCNADCSTCDPQAAHRKALMEAYVESRIASHKSQVLEKKKKAISDFYFMTATPQQRIDIEAIGSIGDPDL